MDRTAWPTHAPWWTPYIGFPALLWLTLWASINTGPWVFNRVPVNMTGWIHCVRAAAPLGVLVIAMLASAGCRDRASMPTCLKLWLAYMLIGVLSCALAPDPLSSAYWAGVYFAVFAALWFFMRSGRPLERLAQLNYLSWFATAAILAILVVVARDTLRTEALTHGTGYGVYHRMATVGGMAMSRSSGMARFAAVPAVVAFVAALKVKGLARLACVLVMLACGALVYFMQSRGAIFGFTFAVIFVLYLFHAQTKLLAMLLIVGSGLALAGNLIPESAMRFVTRGEQATELATLGGRTRDWKLAVDHIEASPLIGWGPQSDRWLMPRHVHNTYLYAALQSGVPGAVLFTAGLGWIWLQALRVKASGIADRYGQRLLFMQCLGVLAFFTVRSIPEVSGAMFGVDLMVMLPAMAYVSTLDDLRHGLTQLVK